MAQQTNKKFRFNVVDIILAILILACIAAIAVFAILGKTQVANPETEKIEYTLKITGVNNDYVDYLKLGSTAYNSSTGNEIGTITNIRTEKEKTYVATENGTIVTESEDTCNVYITLSSVANVGQNGIATIDGNKVLIGSAFYLRVSPFAETAYVIAFEVKGNS